MAICSLLLDSEVGGEGRDVEDGGKGMEGSTCIFQLSIFVFWVVQPGVLSLGAEARNERAGSESLLSRLLIAARSVADLACLGP